MMNTLKRIFRLTWVETLKFWRRPIAKVVLIFMLLGPIVGEILLSKLSPRDATYPRIIVLWFSADMLIFIAFATVVLSIMSLGNDFDLGTVRSIISRGVNRAEFILSKIMATVISALILGLVFIGFAVLSSAFAHIKLSDVPLFEATGRNFLWRTMGAVGVIVLVNFVLSAIVMLALVLGRSSWIGMLGGMGAFFLDFMIGGIGSGSILGVEEAYRYTFTYRAISIIERLFPSDPTLSLPRAWAGQGYASPASAVIVLLLYGVGITLLTVLLFQRQDIKTKG